MVFSVRIIPAFRLALEVYGCSESESTSNSGTEEKLLMESVRITLVFRLTVEVSGSACPNQSVILTQGRSF